MDIIVVVVVGGDAGQCLKLGNKRQIKCAHRKLTSITPTVLLEQRSHGRPLVPVIFSITAKSRTTSHE